MRVTPAMEAAVERVLGVRVPAPAISRAMDSYHHKRSESLLQALDTLRRWMRRNGEDFSRDMDEIRAVLAARSAR